MTHFETIYRRVGDTGDVCFPTAFCKKCGLPAVVTFTPEKTYPDADLMRIYRFECPRDRIVQTDIVEKVYGEWKVRSSS